MSFLEYHLLQEARRNPELAPKVAAITDIKKEVERAELGWGNIHNLFVSFTAIDKLGINPKSKYDTPLAIYNYPADYVASLSSARSVPFAGRSPAINLFKLKTTGNVLILNTMKSATFTDLIGKLRKIYIKIYIDEMKLNYPEYNPDTDEEEIAWKYAIDSFEKIVNGSSQNANVQGLGGRFWYITMVLADKLGDLKVAGKNKEGKGSNKEYYYEPTKSDYNQTNDFRIVGETSLMWNKLFRMIGVDACIDMGDGIIHGGEPTQCAVFNPAAIEMVDRIKNLDPKNNPNKNEGQIINRIGDLMLEAKGEQLAKYLLSVFKSGIETGMIGNVRATHVVANQYINNAFKDVFFRRTSNNDQAYSNGIIKVEAVEATMKAAEILAVRNKFNMESTIDAIIRLMAQDSVVNVYYYWPIVVYLYKQLHTEECNYVLKAILLESDVLAKYEDIMKVCKLFGCEWWNDPDYADITGQFDKAFDVNGDKEFYPYWWSNRKGNV